MTEEEARKKWCPMTGDQRDKCIASDCMMWRWILRTQAEILVDAPLIGYCRLGGKP